MSDTLIIDRDALRAKHASAGFDDLTKLAPLPVERRRAPGAWSDQGEQTELGLPPTRLSFSFLSGSDTEAEAERAPPLIEAPGRRAWRRVHEEFSRTPRSVRLALFALPLLVVIFLPDEPETQAPAPHPSPPSADLAAATAPAPIARIAAPHATEPAHSQPKASTSSLRAPPAKGRTLEARAAELLERGQLAQAAALYEQLAREHPDRIVFADAARILRSVERERTSER